MAFSRSLIGHISLNIEATESIQSLECSILIDLAPSFYQIKIPLSVPDIWCEIPPKRQFSPFLTLIGTEYILFFSKFQFFSLEPQNIDQKS